MKFTLILICLFSTFALAQDRDPLGEVANYDLDKRNRRTSSEIQSGNFRIEVTHFRDPQYITELEYKLKIKVVGTQEGDSMAKVPEDFFTEEFLSELRKDKVYQAPDFRLRWFGRVDARLRNGKLYRNCDYVRFDNFKNLNANPYTALSAEVFRAMGAEQLGPKGLVPQLKIKNFAISAHLFPGVPVFGAVQLDMAGKVEGKKLKAGFDIN